MFPSGRDERWVSAFLRSPEVVIVELHYPKDQNEAVNHNEIYDVRTGLALTRKLAYYS
jgi:hypothetical protein